MHKNWKFAHVSMVVKDMDKAYRAFGIDGCRAVPAFPGRTGDDVYR